MPELAVIIINFNTKKLTLDCLKSVYKNLDNSQTKVVVVDNGSTDDSVHAIKKQFPQVQLIQSDKNLGFAKGNNLALKQVNAHYYLLLNSDTEVGDSGVAGLLNFAKKNNFDIASCRVINPDKSQQPNAGELPKPGSLLLWVSGLDDLINIFMPVDSYQARHPGYFQEGKEVGWVAGSVMLIRDEVVKKIGYLDEEIFMYAEDVEYCFRAHEAGFRVGWTNQAEIVHLGGGSSKNPHLVQWLGEFRGLLYIYKKYYGLLSSLLLRLVFYLFILLRAVIFALLGKLSFAKTYVQVAVKI